VAWLLETQSEAITDNESKAVLEDFVANSNKLNTLTERYRLSGKRETERFISSHIGRVLTR
ncbi:MAG: hypothetical protein VX066_04595, partial [Pseudomonadota bacterium]|nr:hypothetical protein [Pseudomonadota bacterium]